MKSLKTKVIGSVLVIAIVGFIMIALSGFFVARSVILNNVKDVQANKAKKLSVMVNDNVLLWQTQIQTLLVNDAVMKLDFNKFQDVIDSNKDNLDAFNTLMLIDGDGKYEDSNGEKGSIADDQTFQNALGGETSISDPYKTDDGETCIKIISPVKDFSGNTVGAVAGIVDIGQLTDLVESEKNGKTGYTYIVDRNGEVVGEPKVKSLIGHNFMKDKNKTLVKITKDMTEQNENAQYYTENGDAKIIAYSPIMSLGWSVALVTNQKEVLSGLTKLEILDFVIVTLAILIMSVVGYIVIYRAIKPIEKMVKLTKEISDGNLTKKIDIKSNDEIGMLANNFNHMIENMSMLISDVKELSDVVDASTKDMVNSSNTAGNVAEQIADTINEISKGASYQAESAQKGNEMVKTFTDGLKEIETNSIESVELTGNTFNAVEEGVTSIELQKDKMQQNITASKNVESAVTKLSEKSKQIGNIIEVITSISEQTNLLALNAAIEAARAGEAGKGFSVVADEVRKLAEQSKDSADKISQIIKEIQLFVDKAVKEIGIAAATRQEQEEAIFNTTNKFKDIEGSISKLKNKIYQVSKSVDGLSVNAESVKENIENITSVVQQNAASTEEAAASTEYQATSIKNISTSVNGLVNVVERLKEAIGKFKID